MKILDLYLAKSILGATFVVFFGLLSIDFLGQIFAEIDILGDANYSIFKLVYYVLTQLPARTLEFFPTTLLIGSLMGLGRLVSSNELTVMQILGVSKKRVALVGGSVAVLLGIAAILVSEAGLKIMQHGKDIRSEALGERQTLDILSNVWLQDDNRFIHVGGVHSDGSLGNVSIYSFGDKTLSEKLIANTVVPENNNWHLEEITQKIIEGERITENSLDTLHFPNQINPVLLRTLTVKVDELSIPELNQLIQYQISNGITPTHFSLTLWQRLFVPLTALTMFLIALPFVFTNNRSYTQGKRTFIGIFIGIIYYIFYSGFANLVLLLGVPPVIGALLPIAIFLCLALIALFIID